MAETTGTIGPKPGLAARNGAWTALIHTIGEQQMLAIPNDLAPGDRARAQRLATGVLRTIARSDAVLGRHLHRKPELDLHLLLRLGAVELLEFGGAPHGVVDAYVRLAKSRRSTARAKGLVNAVLRKVASRGEAPWAKAKPQRLPAWLRKPLVAQYGSSAVAAMEAAHEAGAATDLTPNGDLEVEGATLLPTGSLRLPQGAQVSALPGFNEGRFWVQDAAAALPVRLLGPVEGKRVLDLCAAPGGKTLQLAAAGAKVTALDISESRLNRLRENLTRTGLSAEIITSDALEWRGGPFDAILLDAPCSATGTIRRHPELPFTRDGSAQESLTGLQAMLIDAALTQLALGGQLVFCTCSLLADEGEAQIEAALARHSGLHAIPADPVSLGGSAEWSAPHGAIRLRPDFWPEFGGMDGFYMATLERR